MANGNIDPNRNKSTTQSTGSAQGTSANQGAGSARAAGSAQGAGSGGASAPTLDQLLQGAAQKGIDLFAANGANFDIVSFQAELRADLYAAGLPGDQVDKTVDKVGEAFQAAVQQDQKLSSTAGAGGRSYDALVTAVGDQVLPSGANGQHLEPKYNGTGDVSQINKQFAARGSQDGANQPITASSDIKSIINKQLATLRGMGFSEGAIAVYMYSFTAALQAKVAKLSGQGQNPGAQGT